MNKIIIIGAGIAGLSAGIYARRNGFDVTIYESHYLPGGMCTAWRRKGFIFEGCLHYVLLVGSSPEHVFHDLWKELDVVPGTKMMYQDVFHTYRDKSGRTLNLYKDANRLKEELLSLSPSDAKEIKALCRAVKRYSWFVRSIRKNPFLLVAKVVNILGGILLLRKYGNMDLSEYAARFNDPLIRHAFTHLFVYPDFAYTQFCFFLAGLHIRDSGYPQGGSLALARTIEQAFLGLGGIIEYRKRVTRILTTDGRATGIELEDGAVETADIIISAADGHATLFDMLEDRYTTPVLRDRYATQPLYHSFVQVSLGVNRDLSGTPRVVRAQTALPFEIAGRTQHELWYQHFAFDPTSAPKGKTSVTVLYPSELAWWEERGYRGDEYHTQKKRILETTIAQLELVFPGISSQIETSDVSTPFTTLRYTNNWKAAVGFIMTKALSAEMTMKPQYSLPGLENFYMTGQWVKGFGVPIAATAGKEVVREICKAHRRKFRST